MTDLKKYTEDSNNGYRIRVLTAIAIVELMVIAIFNFWPVSESTSTGQKIDFSDDAIALEDVVRTEQQIVRLLRPSHKFQYLNLLTR